MYQLMVNKMKLAAAAAAIALVAPVSVASAATVDEVVNKYIEATGGRAAYDGVKSVKMEGEFMLVDMGMGAALTSYRKGGNYLQRIEVEGMGEVTQAITDGVTWQLHFMEGDSVLEGEQAEAVKQQSQLNPYLNWKENFESAEVAGEEDGATKVLFKAKDGNESTVFFAKDTGLITKQEGQGPDGSPATLMFSDYKKVGGLTLAHKTEIQGAMTVEMTFNNVEVNGDISDDVFALPEVIKSQLPEESAAEPTGVTAAQVMAMMDADGDGKITMEEAPEQLAQAFGMVDMNADGGIDVEEAQLIADFMNGQ